MRSSWKAAASPRRLPCKLDYFVVVLPIFDNFLFTCECGQIPPPNATTSATAGRQ